MASGILPPSTFSGNTRNQLRQVLEALPELTTPPEPAKRPIGFIEPQDKKKDGGKQAKK